MPLFEAYCLFAHQAAFTTARIYLNHNPVTVSARLASTFLRGVEPFLRGHPQGFGPL